MRDQAFRGGFGRGPSANRGKVDTTYSNGIVQSCLLRSFAFGLPFVFKIYAPNVPGDLQVTPKLPVGSSHAAIIQRRSHYDTGADAEEGTNRLIRKVTCIDR